MKKRPTIKGRGADIYLGDPAQYSNQRPKKSKASVAEEEARTGNALNSQTANAKSACSLDSLKKAVAWQIEISEKLASQAIEQLEQRTQWAKNAPLAPWFEAQASLARKIIAQSAAAARSLWQIRA